MIRGVFKVLVLAGLASFVSACNDDKGQDTVNPEIISTLINGQDQGIRVLAGDTMKAEAKVSDNEALGQLKIDIHDVFDGHAHKSSAKWAYVNITSLSGKEQTVMNEIEVPVDVTAGPYHCVFRVIDEEGNESDFVEVYFMVGNGSEPQITISNPDFTSNVEVSRGSTLVVEGIITDDTDLEEIHIVLEDEALHTHKLTTQNVIYDQDFDLPGSADLSWDFQTNGNVNIPIPAGAIAGHYVLVVTAKDREGNINIFESELHIL